MKKNLTELVFVLDKSGSMSGLEKDTIGGFNSLIQKQKSVEGEALVSTILFSTTMNWIHKRINLNDVPILTEKEYFVGGCTALLDTIGNTINEISSIHSKLDPNEVPEKTLVVITTDGYENSSSEFSYNTVNKLIKEKSNSKDWEFIFLGADIDAIHEGSKLGIDAAHSSSYKKDRRGTRMYYSAVDEVVKSIRVNKCMSPSWKKELEDEEKKISSIIKKP